MKYKITLFICFFILIYYLFAISRLSESLYYTGGSWYFTYLSEILNGNSEINFSYLLSYSLNPFVHLIFITLFKIFGSGFSVFSMILMIFHLFNLFFILIYLLNKEKTLSFDLCLSFVFILFIPSAITAIFFPANTLLILGTFLLLLAINLKENHPIIQTLVIFLCALTSPIFLFSPLLLIGKSFIFKTLEPIRVKFLLCINLVAILLQAYINWETIVTYLNSFEIPVFYLFFIGKNIFRLLEMSLVPGFSDLIKQILPTIGILLYLILIFILFFTTYRIILKRAAISKYLFLHFTFFLAIFLTVILKYASYSYIYPFIIFNTFLLFGILKTPYKNKRIKSGLYLLISILFIFNFSQTIKEIKVLDKFGHSAKSFLKEISNLNSPKIILLNEPFYKDMPLLGRGQEFNKKFIALSNYLYCSTIFKEEEFSFSLKNGLFSLKATESPNSFFLTPDLSLPEKNKNISSPDGSILEIKELNKWIKISEVIFKNLAAKNSYYFFDGTKFLSVKKITQN